MPQFPITPIAAAPITSGRGAGFDGRDILSAAIQSEPPAIDLTCGADKSNSATDLKNPLTEVETVLMEMRPKRKTAPIC